jgi:hypothetical protein
VKLSGVRIDLDRKTRASKYVKHRMICGDDFRLEDLDSAGGRDFRQLAQQNCSQPAALEIVCNREGDFRSLLVNDYVERVTYDAFIVTAACYQPEGVVQVRLAMSFRRQSGAILRTVKAQPTRIFRERVQQLTQAGLVRRPHHANANGRAIAQYDVAIAMCRNVRGWTCFVVSHS